jgi:hypothetical protein
LPKVTELGLGWHRAHKSISPVLSWLKSSALA